MNKHLFIFCIAAIFIGCTPSRNTDEINSGTSDLPALHLRMISGDSVMANSLGGNSILIFFGPDCDHCQRQAEMISAQPEVFKNYKLYFIASSPKQEITRFAETYRLRNFPNIYFAQAEVAEVISTLGAMSVPTLYIYSEEKRLIKKFVNETSVEEIAKFL